MEKKINKLKNSIKIKQKNNIYYLLNDKGKLITYKPWLGDMFSFLYDRIMSKSIFPKKFNGSIQKHFEILRNELQNIHNKNILEIAAGSGNAVEFLENDNYYTGIDISPGLLKIAEKKFNKNKFKYSEFYTTDASNIPFCNDNFDFSLCNLSLNFFDSIDKFIFELKRVLKPGGIFLCSVPIPEKKNPNVKIRGTLYSEDELKQIFEKNNFRFIKIQQENGALLYFKAQLIMNK